MVSLKARILATGALVAVVVVGVMGCPGGSSPPTPPAPPPSPTGSSPPPPPAPPAGPAAVAGFGSIKGRVLLVRKESKPAVVNVGKDADVCGKTHDPESLKTGGDGAVEGCVVYLKGPAAPADWKKSGTYEIDQKGCHYAPRVMLIPVGETITFKSSDPVAHNVKTAYKAFNQTVTKESPQKLVCDAAEFVELGCSIHPFMAGLLVVQEHPWYVITDASGAFKLDKVPAGTWKIIARHEVLKKHSREGSTITVDPDKETVLDLKFD